MKDIFARELKGHNILAVERFRDETRWMIAFSVKKPESTYGVPGDEIRTFLTEADYWMELQSQHRTEIKINRIARMMGGQILDLKPHKRQPQCNN